MGPALSGELVRVYSTTSLTDGYLARGRLEADGIPVILKGEGEGPYRMGPVHLWVPSEFEVQARLLLQEIREGSFVDDEDGASHGADDEDRSTASSTEEPSGPS